MATYTKIKLSGITGTNLSIQALDFDFIGNPVTLHTSTTSSTILDEVWIWANTSTDFVTGSIIGVGEFTDYFEGPLQKGVILICPGVIIAGDGTNAATISAAFLNPQQTYDSTRFFGYVNRITP